MGVNELRYNVRRMWGKIGLKDSIVDVDGMCYIKFNTKEGMNYVIDQSPWLVNGKPLLVQKWDPETGISALASRLGRPIKMDKVTADMCRAGTGRLGYARVLIEVNAEDEFLDKIEINYVDDMKKVKSTKWVKVEYTWKPVRCTHCKVFGHSVHACDVIQKTKPTVHNNTRPNKSDTNVGDSQEGFVEVKNRKNNYRKVWNKDPQGNKQQPVGVKDVGHDNVAELRKSANKYAVLSDDEVINEVDPFNDKRLIWEAMERQDKENSDEEDVFENIDQATQSFIANEIEGNVTDNTKGMCKESKQKELKNFIAEEKIHVCAILETHLKTKSINKARDYVFGIWRWISNVAHSPTSCRIVVGWNVAEVDVMVIQSCSQTILYLVEIIQTKVRFFVSFVYASNSCVERRNLWNELNMHKNSVSHKAWILMGDFNVTLKPEEHLNGSSNMTVGMCDFKDVVNNLEVEDLCSSGFHFTWTKSLKNAMCSTLKKLDRIMVNDEFLLLFEKAYGIFLPYLISDHSPAILTFPKSISKKRKSFRFANYIADKEEFLNIVREGWSKEVRGTDNAKITRKRSKPDKHGYGNGKNAKEPEVFINGQHSQSLVNIGQP
ncbi:RNA-directed DNA polymerase, eukaryota, reverse transcriptase zinc-binding domain protein [Tanacetum coccineum]